MASRSTEPINLLRGWPNASLLPIEAMKFAATTVLSDPNSAEDGLSYAPDAGYEPLRVAIAKWLTAFYAPHLSAQFTSSADSERVCISGGASQNFACVLQAFTDPIYTRNIWMVVPTYYLACRMVEDAGFHGRIRSVPEDNEGIDIDALRDGIEQAERDANAKGNLVPKIKPPQPWNKRYKHLIYCVPTFSNPSGRTMSIPRREALVRLAREFDALVVADDVYDHLSWTHTGRKDCSTNKFPTKAIAPRLVDIDRCIDGGAEREGADGFGNAISQGTFSKLTGPGCRTGWTEGTPKAVHGLSQVGSSRSGGAPSALVATFLAKMLQCGYLQKWISEKLQPKLASRCQHLRTAIQEFLQPLGVQFLDEGRGATTQEFEGGYFISVQLPREISATRLADRCKRDVDCIIAPGPAFAVPGDDTIVGIDLSRMVRLCFAWEEEKSGDGGPDLLREGVYRMSEVLTVLLQEGITKE